MIEDYDCFYAQVVENAQPALKSLPLGIKQKGILATCNYVARRRGVHKLQAITEAKKRCPDLVLADGEDLSAFRDVSKKLYALLRPYAWNKKVERLGLDEIFLDVTDIVSYNVGLLNRNALAHSFFCLSAEDPEWGFGFDASAIAGCVSGSGHVLDDSYDNPLYVKLILASHLARYLRLKIEEQGYTSACGISTNKLLSKLVGSVNKPRNQTTLLSLNDDDVLAFMDTHGLRQVPGIGGKTTHALESFYLGKEADTDTYTHGSTVSVGQFRTHADVSPQMLEKLLGSRPGAEKGIGDKVWGLLHGVDDTDVKAAVNVPTQISIEDTYAGLNTAEEVERELLKLSASLLRRMHVDIATLDEEQQPSSTFATNRDDDGSSQAPQPRRIWLARPKTLRLSTRPKTPLSDNKPYNWARASRSQPLPTFVFNSAEGQAIVARLVKETLLPMFSVLNPGRSSWNIGMINICVTNMVPTAAETGAVGSGRDISLMFRRQETVLRDFRVVCEEEEEEEEEGRARVLEAAQREDEQAGSSAEGGHFNNSAYFADLVPETWEDLDGSQTCATCGRNIPLFAALAHERYHEFGD